MRLIGFFFMAGLLLAQKAPQDHAPQVQDRHSNERQDRMRGQTRPPDESQSWTRGRLGTQKPLAGKVIDLTGILIDASCEDRTALNLRRPPEQPDLAKMQTADRAVPTKPPADALAHQTPDVVARQADRSCAVTGATRGFSLLMPEGRLLNLDEGGNTFVFDALQSNPAGRAMLNGTGPALKPQATLRGRVQGDRFIVDKIVKL
jgi:hypothetical protein